MSTPSPTSTPELLNDVQVERSGGGNVTLRIEVAPQAVRECREKTLRTYARRMKIPGFRPGHAPVNIIRRNVGDEAIASQIGDELVQQAYQEALKRENLRPLVEGQISNLQLDPWNENEPMRFEAAFIARPDIELGELNGLPVEMPAIEVSEEDIDQTLENIRLQNAVPTEVTERGAKEGDILSAELQVFLGGVPREEEPTRLRSFLLGESGFVPSIDEHLVGATLDEERRFNVTYPADFQDAELAGQVADFVVKVTSIKERILPELNDDLARQMTLDNLEHLRERVRETIHNSRLREAQHAAHEKLVQEVVAGAQFELPAAIVNIRMHNREHEFEHELEHKKKTLEQYFEEEETTREAMEDEWREEITTALRRELVLEEIGRQQELSVSQQEMETYYLQMAQMLGAPVETLIERFDVNFVHASLLRSKAADWLFEHSAGGPASANAEGTAGGVLSDDATPAEENAADSTIENAIA